MTALMKAVKKNDGDAVREFVGRGGDVNERDANGDVPLIMAAYLGHADIVDQLLRAGADVSAVDPEMKATALHAAAYAGHAAVARLLIQGKIDIDRQGPNNGFTALHDAIWQNNVETAKVLVEAGANLQIANHAGQTPLAFARAKKHGEIVALIEAAIARGRRR